jgi:DNA invertase Pin-like site-specific DNA recombinase
MRLGYARVSTEDQHLELQQDALLQYGCERIFEDRISGSKSERPGLQAAFDQFRPGDSLIVWRLDRLGRSIKDLIRLVEQLDEKQVSLISLQENLDTSTSSGKLIFHIFSALAEFERNLILERTQAGLHAARSRGRKGGRPRSLNQDQQKLLFRLYDERKHTIDEICRMLDIAKSTLYSYLSDRNTIREHKPLRGDLEV